MVIAALAIEQGNGLIQPTQAALGGDEIGYAIERTRR